MSKTFDQGRTEVAKLCRYFATNRDSFHAPGVKEAHVRQSLIDPFFEALGWDVGNTQMIAPQYREVIPEDSLDVEGQQKAPDYVFRVGTLPKFYVEAKKCGMNLNVDPGPAYQLRRYGWSGKVAVSLLTDFEELGVYDCTLRPRPSDKASHARILFFRAEEYPDRWREIWDVFSREAVWSGAFDQYAASKRKRGTSEVDAEFLKEIEGWRDALARNMALRNDELSSDDLNAAVQRTIDRVVFLRMAEDRNLEPYEQLLKLCESPNVYARFMRDLCRKADEKYNSGLFHFQKEAGVSEAPDQITPKLTVDDKVLKPILESLYFEHGSPYHFGVLPVEILGTVYERFLGKVIRLTAGHQAKIEDKPAVRKAGGVYYTPAYIVDYIVKHTIGEQIEGRSPAQLAGGKGNPPFRVLDMACGSGSFLLGAYQCLIDHCFRWYLAHKPEANKKAVFKDPRTGHWRLSIDEKKRILTTHLFGVDIDPQAVEVSKLSLLLKALEGENSASLTVQLKLLHERALPNLAENIKCGNSLIGNDYFTDSLVPDSDEIKRINPFDWEQGFPEAMKAGGFDCVIGNPPYLGGREWKEEGGRRYGYLVEKYDVAEYQFDIYALFWEQGIKLLQRGGLIGFITPNTWLNNQSNRKLRDLILQNTSVRSIADYSRVKVFPKAVVLPIISILKKARNPGNQVEIYRASEKALQLLHRVPQELWMSDENRILNIDLKEGEVGVRNKIERGGVALGSIAEVKFGIKLYETGKGDPPQKPEFAEKQIYESTRRIDSTYRRYLEGKDVDRYQINWQNRWLKYGPNLAAPRESSLFEGDRLLVRRIVGNRLIACFTYDDFVTSQLLQIVKPNDSTTVKYVLGILCSSLMAFYFRKKYNRQDKTFPEIRIYELASLPIRAINSADTSDKARRDKIDQHVESMLSLNSQLRAARSVSQESALQRQIDATDAKIDRLVYDLYGLTEKEIAIVEGTRG